MNDLTLSQIIYPELKTTYRLGNSCTNFHIWRFKLDFVLVDNQVRYVLTEPKPSASASKDKDKDKPKDVGRHGHDKWVADDFKARHITLGTLDDNLYIPFAKYESAKSLMDALTRTFTKSFFERQTLYRRYSRHIMKEGTSINQHIFEMEAMARELELDGFKIPEDVQCTLLIESLPESWNDAVALIKMNLYVNEALVLENVRDKLIKHGGWEQFNRDRDEDEGRGRRSTSSSRDGSRRLFNGICHNCGEFGRRKFDCPN